ncbi:hypothetical protein TGVAND_273610 [Toxoplasma gondii VAND]|uniref:Uncharacterized protein n=1 Tax=Toxoplasma gondii VAND TaxID=933077 RepID=A0A086QG54_TOXGO|nr:hypothetical protein TGVAND_273610 [Toxoplasma gondii VAND]
MVTAVEVSGPVFRLLRACALVGRPLPTMPVIFHRLLRAHPVWLLLHLPARRGPLRLHTAGLVHPLRLLPLRCAPLLLQIPLLVPPLPLAVQLALVGCLLVCPPTPPVLARLLRGFPISSRDPVRIPESLHHPKNDDCCLQHSWPLQRVPSKDRCIAAL